MKFLQHLCSFYLCDTGPSIYDVHRDGGEGVQPEVDACGQGRGKC